MSQSWSYIVKADLVYFSSSQHNVCVLILLMMGVFYKMEARSNILYLHPLWTNLSSQLSLILAFPQDLFPVFLLLLSSQRPVRWTCFKSFRLDDRRMDRSVQNKEVMEVRGGYSFVVLALLTFLDFSSVFPSHVLQSHCVVDPCITALFLTQKWDCTCGPRIWTSVSRLKWCLVSCLIVKHFSGNL